MEDNINGCGCIVEPDDELLLMVKQFARYVVACYTDKSDLSCADVKNIIENYFDDKYGLGGK